MVLSKADPNRALQAQTERRTARLREKEEAMAQRQLELDKKFYRLQKELHLAASANEQRLKEKVQARVI